MCSQAVLTRLKKATIVLISVYRTCRYFFYFEHTTFGLFILCAPNGYYYQTMFSGVFYRRAGEINASFQTRIFE